MNKSIIPNVDRTGIPEMMKFIELMHSMTEIHEQHQHLIALQDQDPTSMELQALNFLTKALSDSACKVVSMSYDNIMHCM